MSNNTLSKRGIGWPWDNPASQFPLYASAISNNKISWLFNWELWKPEGLPSGLEYVPQVRLGTQAKDIIPFLSSFPEGSVKHFFGFNEPDIADQANMGVDEGVKLWKDFVEPAKKKFGFRLGSPGVSSDPKGKRWLQEFFQKLGREGSDNVDFLVVHWYGMNVGDFEGYLKDMHDTFGKPLWVNEVACSCMGGRPEGVRVEEVEGFLQEAMQFMDGCEFVERYSYFGSKTDVGDWVGKANNFTDEGKTFTRIGRMYTEL